MADSSTSTSVLLGLHHLKTPVSSLERSLAFYTTFLGGEHLPALDHVTTNGSLYAQIVRLPGHPGAAAAPPLLLELRLNPARASALRGFNLYTFAVQTEADVERWLEKAAQHGVECSGKIRSMIGYRVLMEDPDGVRVQVYSLEKLREPWDPSQVREDPRWIET